MISDASITELIETYKKFDWLPRRLLLRAPSETIIGNLSDDLPTAPSQIDAIWFSRSKQEANTPWELRHLGANPLSLLEHLDEDSPDFEKQLSALELRMAELLKRRKPA